MVQLGDDFKTLPPPFLPFCDSFVERVGKDLLNFRDEMQKHQASWESKAQQYAEVFNMLQNESNRVEDRQQDQDRRELQLVEREQNLDARELDIQNQMSQLERLKDKRKYAEAVEAQFGADDDDQPGMLELLISCEEERGWTLMPLAYDMPVTLSGPDCDHPEGGKIYCFDSQTYFTANPPDNALEEEVEPGLEDGDMVQPGDVIVQGEMTVSEPLVDHPEDAEDEGMPEIHMMDSKEPMRWGEQLRGSWSDSIPDNQDEEYHHKLYPLAEIPEDSEDPTMQEPQDSRAPLENAMAVSMEEMESLATNGFSNDQEDHSLFHSSAVPCMPPPESPSQPPPGPPPQWTAPPTPQPDNHEDLSELIQREALAYADESDAGKEEGSFVEVVKKQKSRVKFNLSKSKMDDGTSDPGSSGEAGYGVEVGAAHPKEVRWCELDESDKEDGLERKPSARAGVKGGKKGKWDEEMGGSSSSAATFSAASAFPELPKPIHNLPSSDRPPLHKAPGSKVATGDKDPMEVLRRFLSGKWVGGKGETYEVDFKTLQCTRCMPDGSTYVFKLEWQPDERAVKWGVSFMLYADELKKSPTAPVWHGMKRKGSYFKWRRERGFSSSQSNGQSLNPPSWQAKRR